MLREVTDTISWRSYPTIDSCNWIDFIDVALPDGATEGMAKHSSRLQPSINVHDPVTAFMLSCFCSKVQLRRDEGSSKPCAVIEA